MAYDDLPLDHGPNRTAGRGQGPSQPIEPPHRHDSPSPVRWAVVAIIALAAGGALAYWWMTRAQPDEALPAPAPVSESARASSRPQRQPMELPSVDTSDTFFRDLVSVLSRNPMLARLLATNGLVRRATLAVDQMADGRTPSTPLVVMRPPTRLAIAGTDTGPIDPRTYARWDSATAALTSVNPAEAAQLYVNVKPLFDSAWADLGHPDGNFDTAITRAIDTLAATPTVSTPPVLLRRPGYFEHTDGTLRGLRPVQKQLLLAGPESQARILNWLRQFANALDLPIAGSGR